LDVCFSSPNACRATNVCFQGISGSLEAGLDIFENSDSAGLPDDLVERIEGYLDRVRDNTPLRSMKITRADVIRELLEVGLEAEEKRFLDGRRKGRLIEKPSGKMAKKKR
jgi:hypothetical protein